MRIAMIGTGYVGLVSGACFADFGHRVCCVDKDASKIDRLNDGVMPIWEPGLEALVKANMGHGRLTFTTDLPAAVEDAEAVFIAVGTPARRGDGHADLTYVFDAVRELARVMKPGTVVVTKSTVPVGTGDQIEQILREEGVTEASVASNPEFLREGAAIADFKHPDRIVVGAEDGRAQDVLREIYRPLFLNRAPILITGRRTAELTKYAANAFLAVKISFINEIADLCEAVDADVQDVARGIGLDNRIGAKFLHAGPGYGGSCFPKDTLALLQTADAAGVDQRIVRTTVAVNDDRKASMVERVERALGGDLGGKARRSAWTRIQAEHRRHARSSLDSDREGPGGARRRGLRIRPGCSPSGRAECCPESNSPTMPMPPPVTPMCWSSSRNGMNSAPSISIGLRLHFEEKSWSTYATSTTLTRPGERV